MKTRNETRSDQSGLFTGRPLVSLLFFQMMSVFAWLLWALLRVIVAGPFERARWSEGENSQLIGEDVARLRPSFLQLPMFHHAPAPLVARELFRPVHHRRPLPVGLTSLLFPPTTRPQSVQETDARAVEVWCGVDKVSVRVDRMRLRTWTDPSLFRLGSCQASRITPHHVHFNYGLRECGEEAKVVGGQLVYTYSLKYTPPPQEHVLRVVPLNFPIHCHYNRFYYSYQVGFRPQLQHTTFMKSLKTKRSFSLTVCNAEWEPLPPGYSFFLGEQVHFVARTGALVAGERLYVDSCHATSSKDPDGTPRLDIISNYGCMLDSRRKASSSKFLLRRAGALKFSVDAFLFKAVSQMLYLHCSMSVGLATSFTSKSCNYDRAAGRWEELEAPRSVCSCCDSVCRDRQHSMEYTVSSPGWLIGQKGEEKPRLEISFQAQWGRDWLNQELESKVRTGERLRKVQTSQTKPEIDNEEEKEVSPEEMSLLPAEEKEWGQSTAISWWGKEKESEMEEVAVAKEDDQMQELASDANIMSDQSSPKENEGDQAREEGPSLKHDSLSGLFSNSSSYTSAAGSATTIGMDHNTTNHGFDEGASSAVIPIVHEGKFDDGLAILARTLPAPSDVDHPGFDVRKSRLESDTFNALLSSENWKPVNKSVNTMSDGIPQRAGDSVSSKGADGDEDMLHSLQIRGLESDQSAHPPGLRGPSCVEGLLCESDFDFGIEEGETLHLSQFTGAVMTAREVQDFSGSIPKTHGVSPGSASSEQIHQDSASHSAVVAVSTLQDSASHQMTDEEWSEVAPRWGLQSFRFVVEQPTESFDAKSLR